MCRKSRQQETIYVKKLLVYLRQFRTTIRKTKFLRIVCIPSSKLPSRFFLSSPVLSCSSCSSNISSPGCVGCLETAFASLPDSVRVVCCGVGGINCMSGTSFPGNTILKSTIRYLICTGINNISLTYSHVLLFNKCTNYNSRQYTFALTRLWWRTKLQGTNSWKNRCLVESHLTWDILYWCHSGLLCWRLVFAGTGMSTS